MNEQLAKVSRNLFGFLILLFVIVLVKVFFLAFDEGLSREPFNQSNKIERTKQALTRGVVSCNGNNIVINGQLVNQNSPADRRVLYDAREADRAGAFTCGNRVLLRADAETALGREVCDSLQKAIDAGHIRIGQNGQIHPALAAPLIDTARQAIRSGYLLREVVFDESVFRESNPRLRRAQVVYSRGRILDRAGQTLAETVDEGTAQKSRRYPLGEKTFHIIGYLGHPTDPVASEGLESVFTGLLGRPPTSYWRLLARSGNPISRILQLIKGELELPPLPTLPDLTLTIDAELTNHIWESLAGFRAGAVAVIDVNTGEVLAAVSKPGLDPAADADTWRLAFRDTESSRRLVRRAWQELYFPGSTFKIITAAAALDQQSIPNQDQGFTLQLDRNYKPCGYGTAIEGHRTGAMRLDEAFAISDNEFFARLTVETLTCPGLHSACSQFEFFNTYSLLPKRLGDIDKKGYFTVAGNCVTQAKSQTCPASNFDDCMLGRTGIGQQDVKVSPLWMASLAAAVANGGNWIQPSIVKEIVTYDEDTNAPYRTAYPPADPQRIMNPATAATLTALMERVTVANTRDASGTPRSFNGTASQQFRGFSHRIAGKTGTAETGRGTNHAWFVAFGPLPQPRYAIAVVLEDLPSRERGFGGNTGGRQAAPIARSVFEFLIQRDQIPAAQPAAQTSSAASHANVAPAVPAAPLLASSQPPAGSGPLLEG